MSGRKLFALPGRADRRGTVGLLALANTPVLLALMATFWFAASTTRLPGWVALVLWGCLTGQALALAYWFSLSADTLWFRLAMLLATILGFALAYVLAGIPLQLQLIYSQRVTASALNFDWSELALEVALSFVALFMITLAVFSFTYAVFVPIRRLRGYSLSTVQRDLEQPAARRQFQIYEWMFWTVLVAIPLVLVRLVMFMGDMESEVRYFYGTLLFVGLVPLAVGWPVFRAGLAERRPLVWTAATFGTLAVFGWLLCEAAYRFNIDRLTQTPGSLSSLFRFWPFETFVLSAAACLALNSLALRWLGFRLRRTGRQPAPDSSSSSARIGEIGG